MTLQEEGSYKRLAFTDKKTCVHSRIIWGCAWSHDDKYFVTVSRDKKVLMWGVDSSKDQSATCTGQYTVCSSLTLPDSITAVDFSPVGLLQDRYLLVFGCDNGSVFLYTWTPATEPAWKHYVTLDKSEAHHLTVKRVKFCPVLSNTEKKTDQEEKDNAVTLKLASCGADHIVRIYRVKMEIFS